jgi:hypothetical protein
VIAKYQPYETAKRGFPMHSNFLWLLRELSNESKHRLITATVGRFLVTRPLADGGPIFGAGPSVAVIDLPPQPLTDGTNVGDETGLAAQIPNPEMHIKRLLSLEVILWHELGHPVESSLSRIGDGVAHILTAMAPEFGTHGDPPPFDR